MLRFFVETLPLAALRQGDLLARVASAADGLVLAVRPHESELDRTVAAVREVGLKVALWPMLDDASGRWCTLANAESFVEFAAETVRDARIAAGDALLLDLEPPWRVLDALAHGRVRDALSAYRALVPQDRRHIESAERRVADFAERLHTVGVAVQTAEFPWALTAPAWGRRFGVPHLAGPAARGVMLYTSMLEGYAGGLLGRRRAVQCLRRLGAAALTRLGADVELQLGAVGAGALSHEPVYRDVTELECDLGVAVDLGCRRIAVFELGGILRRNDAERWLRACAHTRDVLRHRLPGLAEGGSIHEEAQCDSYVPS